MSAAMPGCCLCDSPGCADSAVAVAQLRAWLPVEVRHPGRPATAALVAPRIEWRDGAPVETDAPDAGTGIHHWFVAVVEEAGIGDGYTWRSGESCIPAERVVPVVGVAIARWRTRAHPSLLPLARWEGA